MTVWKLFVLRIVTWSYNYLQNIVIINIRNHIIVWNTWNHTIVCKLLELDRNTWNYTTLQIISFKSEYLKLYGQTNDHYHWIGIIIWKYIVYRLLVLRIII